MHSAIFIISAHHHQQQHLSQFKLFAFHVETRLDAAEDVDVMMAMKTLQCYGQYFVFWYWFGGTLVNPYASGRLLDTAINEGNSFLYIYAVIKYTVS